MNTLTFWLIFIFIFFQLKRYDLKWNLSQQGIFGEIFQTSHIIIVRSVVSSRSCCTSRSRGKCFSKEHVAQAVCLYIITNAHNVPDLHSSRCCLNLSTGNVNPFELCGKKTWFLFETGTCWFSGNDFYMVAWDSADKVHS